MKRMLLTLFLLLTLAAAAQAQEAARSLTVTGSGTATGVPDMALVHLGVQTSDGDVLAAFNRSNQITADIVEALLALGIERQDIRTSGLSLYQDRPYDPFSDVEDGTIIYWAQNSLEVTLRDIDLVGQALGASVQAGANSIERLSYGLSDPSALETQARERAVADARSRAEQLAALTGSQLGRVFSINETGDSFSPRAEMRAVAMMADSGGAATVEAGQLSVSIQLQITWELQ